MEQKNEVHPEVPTQGSVAASGLGFSLSHEEIDEMSELLQGCPPGLEFIDSLKKTVEMCKELGSNEKPSPLDSGTQQKMREAYEAMRKNKLGATSR